MSRKNKKKNKKGKKIILICFMILLVIILAILVAFLTNKNTTVGDIITSIEEPKVTEKPKKISKVDVIDINSKTRPYAIVVNNTPVAVKVQTGLNKAYLVYEIPTEGNTSRLMVLYKDVNEDLTVGTIRSSRHNFIDYAYESNAIFVHYGWSHYAEDEQNMGIIDFINGLYDKPFWRNNPERLATEHTAYTSLGKIRDEVKEKGFRTESEGTILLNYSPEDIELNEKENVQIANEVIIPYGSKPNVTSFKYDENTKMYNRIENGNLCIDYQTKEQITTKNIIVQKINYEMCSDNYYWNLRTVGTGEGYYITNGYAIPIKWSKTSRKAKTKYTDLNENEIEVSDGRTYIEIQTNKYPLTIQ